MKLIIGIVGEKGSGKETFTDFLKLILSDKKIERIRFSDVLTETLKNWGISQSRHNYQSLAILMEKNFGPGAISRAIRLRVLASQADLVVLDGVRWPTDADLVRGLENNLLVYITATVRLRYQRLKNRTEKEGEMNMTFAQFMQEEQVETELNIPKIGKTADLKIINDQTLEDFKQKVKLSFGQSTFDQLEFSSIILPNRTN